MIEHYKNLSLENIIYIDDNGKVQEEEWKAIPDTQNRYEISNLSRVKSNSFMRYHGFSATKTKPLILKQYILKIGYPSVRFSFNSKTKGIYIHRRVAKAFIPNPENKPQVNHKDGNKLNNAISNLEWVTHQENSIHAHDTGLHYSQKGEEHCRAILTESQVLEIRKECKENQSIFLAKKYNVHPATISAIKQYRSWKHLP